MSTSEMSTWPVRGLCIGVPKPDDWQPFTQMVSEVLPELGCNTMVLLIRYRYQFQSHPDVADRGALSLSQAQELSRLCREHGIRLIPKMNLLGHQSERERGSELGLLRAYPDFDETPELDSVRYCRSLCPRHPQVKGVVFDLIDEMLDAFQADAIHIGTDEVFEIGHCPRCKGTPNATLFGDWISALHGHVTGKRGAELWMWGDRLLNAETTGYGEWEASANHTWEAIDALPRDIVMCDWHYEERETYPSIPTFAEQGFRLVACPWRNAKAASLLLDYAIEQRATLPAPEY